MMDFAIKNIPIFVLMMVYQMSFLTIPRPSICFDSLKMKRALLNIETAFLVFMSPLLPILAWFTHAYCTWEYEGCE